MRTSFLRGFLGWMMLGCFAVASGAEYWNQFRGPRGDGTANVESLPVTWSETEHVKWKTPLKGKAWSSPVVWDKQIWLTNALADGTELYAVCLDLATGEVLHDITLFKIEKPQFCIERNSYASSTPVVEEGRLYAHFGSHGTACIDTTSGKVVWSRQDLECDHFRGAGSSPLVWKDQLILTFDGFDAQYVTALDKRTGTTLWRRDREFPYGTDNGDAKKAYSTPQLVMHDNEPQLISPSAAATAAYDPRTGKELWRVKHGGMNASCRPVLGNGMAFIGTADGGFHLFALKLGGKGDVAGDIVWKLSKGSPRYSSPILVGEQLYMGNEQGIVTCVQASSGEVAWQARLSGLFMPSPIFAGGHLYFFTEEGTTYVLEPGNEKKLIATNKLDDGMLASPAVAENRLILRTKKAVYCIE